jgi:alpha-glucosidase
MNEPTVFHTPSGTMPLDVRHDNEGSPAAHREIHNVYGMLMSRATYEGLLRLRPGERPFVLTRSSFAGGQRYAAVWPGDNTSDWSHLRQSLPTLLGLGLSGFPFVGSDIGGFAGVPSAELFTRWLQVGVFYPFMRAHTELNTPDQEPWSFGSRHEELNRRAIELRYQLLPEIYNVMAEASATGLPAMRPLFLEYPDDAQAGTIDDEFLFGEDLLVAPVLKEAATDREIYLPKGEWFDYWTGRRFEGGATIRMPVTIESIPLFVRGGAFVFRQPVVQHTGEMAGQPLMVAVYPADRSDAHYYEDDGGTTAYREGASVRRLFSQRRGAGRCALEVGAPDGAYRPPARDLVLQVAWEGEPGRVLAGGSPVSRGTAAPGWVAGDGFVSIRLADRWDAFSVVLER